MAKRLVSLSCVAVFVLACEQRITGPGACPEFCPVAEIEMIDTLLGGVIVDDISFPGYVQPHEATAMQVAGGGGPESRAVFRFDRFAEVAPITSTATAPIVARDSFELKVIVSGRSPGVSGLEIGVYRAPRSVDTESSFGDLDPFFQDSMLVAVMAIPDTFPTDDSSAVDTVSVAFPDSLLPLFEIEERQVTLGLAVRGNTAAFMTIGSRDGARPAALIQYVQVDSAGVDTVPSSNRRTVEFDTFVSEAPASPQPSTLIVGGSPSTRSFLRVSLPPSVFDSGQIVGAKLLLVPVEPVLGTPGDSLVLVANALSADFGPKSPLIVPLDSTLVAGAPVAVGSTDTIALDIAPILSVWQENPELVRTLVLRVRREGTSVAELRVGSSSRIGAEPAIRLTFVPPFSFGQR